MTSAAMLQRIPDHCRESDWVDIRLGGIAVFGNARLRATEPPWAAREARWDRAAKRSRRPGYPIKGGVPLPHALVHYEQTFIDESKGERRFCDEAEAIAAGWRAARSR